MSRLQGEIALHLGSGQVQACCRQAIADLGWTVNHDEPGLLEAREDLTQLACCQSPAQSKFEIASSADGCQLRLATNVPGFGPLSSSQVRGRHAAVVRTLHRHLMAARGQRDD